MEKTGLSFPEPESMDVLIVTLGDDAKKHGIWLAKDLRNKGFKCDMDVLERNMKGQLKYADRKGFKYAVIIGDNELQTGKCQVKDLKNSTQEDVLFDELTTYLAKL